MKVITPILRQIDRRRIYGRWSDWWNDLQTRRTVRSWNGQDVEPVATQLRGLKWPAWLRIGTTDFCVASEIFQDDEYELALKHVGQPKTILDLGTNVGLSLLLFADRFPDARIIGAEPSPQNFKLAVRNVGSAGLSDRVSVRQICVNDRGGTIDFEVGGSSWAFHIASAESKTSIRVPCITAASLIDDLGGTVDFLKCDIEGAEEQVFANCRDWIQKVRVMVVETHGDYTPERFIADVKTNGGRFVTYRSTKAQSLSVVVMVREN